MLLSLLPAAVVFGFDGIDWSCMTKAIAALEQGPRWNPLNCRQAVIDDLRTFGCPVAEEMLQFHPTQLLTWYTSTWLRKHDLPLTPKNIAQTWRWGPHGALKRDAIERYGERAENLYRVYLKEALRDRPSGLRRLVHRLTDAARRLLHLAKKG